MKFNDNITSTIKNYYEFLVNIFSNIKNLLLTILDAIINGIETKDNKHKYYTYFITSLIILILGLFYYLNEKQDLFKIKDTKYEILASLIMIGISIYLFLFFVYRNNNKWNIPIKNGKNNTNYNFKYNNNYDFLKKKFIETENDPKSNSKNQSKKINSEKLKSSLTFPLGNLFKYLAILFTCFIVPLILINFILYMHKDNNSIFNITQTFLGVIICIVIFAIVAKVFSIQSTTNSFCELQKGKLLNYILCIIKNIIFFIPCLLVIAVDEINKDIKLTPSSVYILFFILLLLITIIFLLPLLFKYIRTINKSDILSGEGPYYLNQKKILGNYQNLNKNIGNIVKLPRFETLIKDPVENKIDNLMETLKIDKNYLNIFNSNKDLEENNTSIDLEKNSKSSKYKLFKNDLNGVYNIETNYYNPEKGKNKFPYNYTYSISFYIYINPQPTNTSLAYSKDTELFNYGFKPVIYYNGKSRKIIIKSRTINNKGDQLDTIYETFDIKYQKWLYFVINYDNNIIDIFIDGKLVGSKNNVTPYFKGDTVTIGEHDGIHGSIKEIYYYDKIKTPDSIQFLYNLTKNKK